MKLVVGIGNPGRRYEGTRHNAGFTVVDRLSARHDVPLKRSRLYNADTGRGRIEGEPVALAKPQSYVNRTCPVVAKLARDLEKERAKKAALREEEAELLDLGLVNPAPATDAVGSATPDPVGSTG